MTITCEEMLRDRGCARVTCEADALETIRDGTPLLRGRGGRVDYDIYVHGEERVGVKFARNVLEASDSSVVIVSIEGPTPFTRKECEGRPVQFLLARDLCYNVTHHALVPHHERVAEAPAPPDKLPKILDTDSVAQYHGWPVGTVVRVWRHFGGHEPVPYFRVVALATGGVGAAAAIS